MANVSFTRDEVILALDVLYFSGEERLNPYSDTMKELSDLLRSLPIHPLSAHNEVFRNQTGVTRQLSSFRSTYSRNKKDDNVGSIFYEVANEYDGRLYELHDIATAIRANAPYYQNLPYGAITEMDGFPEGALLGHLHRSIERRDGAKVKLDDRCVICQIETQSIYKNNLNLLEQHLTTPLVKLEWRRKYDAANFITVCPNCHAALHRYRPWLTKEYIGGLLK